MPKAVRSKLYTILTDREYIGGIKFRGQWYQGTHQPLIDQKLWQRVQTLLGHKVYKQHQMTYASDLIECSHCGSPITGERKFKMTKSGERKYVYYRCTQYHKGDHPRKGVVTRWERMRRNNHWLDALYNASAARHHAGVRLIDSGQKPTRRRHGKLSGLANQKAEERRWFRDWNGVRKPSW